MNPISPPQRRDLGFALLAGLVVAAACARVRPLEGGPADERPPQLVATTPPDSTTGLSRLPRFELVFDERVGSASARTGIRFEPPVRLGEVKVQGHRVTVTLAESLPPDTTVVLVLGKTIQDLPPRGNKLGREIRLLYSTGPRLQSATVLGVLKIKGQANPKAAVRWEPVPPDSGRAGRRGLGPVTGADPEGLFRLVGLPPGRAFVLRGFLDQNENLWPDDDELAAVYPETLRLAAGAVRRGLTWNVIDPKEPGQVSGVALDATRVAGPVAVALRQLDAALRAADTSGVRDADSTAARADTVRPRAWPVPARAESPWSAAYAALEPRGFVRREWVVVYASPRGDYSVRVPPGKHALVAFVDVRRDSSPGLYVLPDSSGLAWEPLWVGDTLRIDPGSKVRPRSIEIRGP